MSCLAFSVLKFNPVGTLVLVVLMSLISQTLPRVEKTGLCDLDPNVSLGDLKDKFTADHGKIINANYTFLVTTSFKSLKGAERETVTKLQDTVRRAAQLVVLAFIHNDFVPYMGNLEAAFNAKKSEVEPVLNDTSCLCQLQGGVFGNSNGGAIVETLKEFSSFMHDLASAADGIFSPDSEGIEAVKAQAWIRNWRKHSSSVLKAVDAFEKIPVGSADQDTVLSATMMLDKAFLSRCRCVVFFFWANKCIHHGPS